ncbi:MAG: aldehyde ferredoxin oxidoreductase, partial [Deltaproteobacteria bacterium]|nr:aldehyde ferredoxin oxidoreductase [Deltaproteobacteria bacterium]
MNCFAGNMLFVDLTKREISVEPLKQEWIDDYWGCWGLALRYYWEEVSPTVDPLSPENALVLMTGTLSGTLTPLSGRMCLVSKSPQSG